MRIVHRISLRADKEDVCRLGLFGFHAERGQFFTIRIDESDPRWPEMLSWIAQREPADLVVTTFTKKEIARADWVELSPAWHHGYPQPENEYNAVTYSSTGCAKCGVGKFQAAAFRLPGEPRWGRKCILQLNWIFDEYFVTPDVWNEVFRPLNVRCRPVLDRCGDRELETVVQLVASEEVPVVLAGAPCSTCPACGQKKYASHTRGPFPRLEWNPKAHYFHTAQWFGDGGIAYRGVIASREVVRAMAQYGVRGALPWPLAL